MKIKVYGERVSEYCLDHGETEHVNMRDGLVCLACSQPNRGESLASRYRFFREHAGYVVGRRAETSMALARAEQAAEERGWFWEWVADDDYEPEENEPSEAWGCILRDEHWNHLESLWGITGERGDPYFRVIQAELAREADASVRHACSKFCDPVDRTLYGMLADSFSARKGKPGINHPPTGEASCGKGLTVSVGRIMR